MSKDPLSLFKAGLSFAIAQPLFKRAESFHQERKLTGMNPHKNLTSSQQGDFGDLAGGLIE